MVRKENLEKTNQPISDRAHNIVIGQVPNKDKIEFWTTSTPLNIYFYQSGKTFTFGQLPIKTLIEIYELLNMEPKKIRKELREQHPNIIDRLKRYAIYLFDKNDNIVN